MADAGRRERGGDVAVDAVAQPDEDPGGQPGLGFGQDRGEGVAGAAAEPFQAADRAVRSGRRPRAGPHRACPTRRSARGTRRTACRAAAARGPRRRRGRLARPPGSGAASRRARKIAVASGLDEPQRRDLVAVARRPDGLHDHRPRPSAVGRPVASRRRQGRRSRRSAMSRGADGRRADGAIGATPAARPAGSAIARSAARWRRAGTRVAERRQRAGRRRPRRRPASRCAARQRHGHERRAAARTSSRRGCRATAGRRPRRTAPRPAPRGSSRRSPARCRQRVELLDRRAC